MDINSLARVLSDSGIEDALFEVRILAERFLGLKRAEVLLLGGEGLEAREGFDGLFEAVLRRAQRYPLQYILGEWEFFGLRFTVNESCLIPRPDTEVIVERCLELLSRYPADKPKRILDLCTGSGCIGGAILASCPNSSAVLADIDEGTVALARKNLAELGLASRADVICADAFSYACDEKFDLIVSNPPYISAEEMLSLEPELSFEPRIALTDGADGLKFYREIIERYPRMLSEGGYLVLEFGYRQGEAVRALAEERGLCAELIYDYGGNVRGLITKIKGI